MFISFHKIPGNMTKIYFDSLKTMTSMDIKNFGRVRTLLNSVAEFNGPSELHYITRSSDRNDDVLNQICWIIEDDVFDSILTVAKVLLDKNMIAHQFKEPATERSILQAA